MKSGFLATVKKLVVDNPTVYFRYDIQTSGYKKAKDADPSCCSRVTGKQKISLRRVAAGIAIVSAVTLGACVADLLEKKK